MQTENRHRARAGIVPGHDSILSPFDMPQYVLDEQIEAETLQAESTELFRQANELSDEYMLLTVLFATVLFFTGVAGKFQWRLIDAAMLNLGTLVFVYGALRIADSMKRARTECPGNRQTQRANVTAPIALTIPDHAPPAFHMLAKPTGAICNLDCAYCFFLDKEVFYPGSKFRMSDETLEQYIKQLIEAHRADEVTIAWQGGEPTIMGLDFYRRAMALVEKYRRPGMRFLHTMQTNGTLARRGMGGLLQRAQLPHRHQHRWTACTARCLPGGQGRRPNLRQGHARYSAAAETRHRVQRADHGQPRSTPTIRWRSTASCATRWARPGCSSFPWSNGSTRTG